jgi:catechol 2,3-dioxygenase-like lactoylglutathione lyase family enzyme
MSIRQLHHVGVVVSDLQDAADFFALLGLQRGGEGSVQGEWADRIVALDGLSTDLLFMQTPDGHGRIELISFKSPAAGDGGAGAPANGLGIRHLAFEVEDIDSVLERLRERGVEPMGELVRYQDSYRLCYVRGPEGIIVELAESLG